MQIAKSCNHKRPCYDDGKCHFTKPCEHQYLTNADRIRAMSDEELAATLVLEPMGEKIPFCQNKPECDKLLDEDRDIPDEMCAKCMLDWLKQEVKE